MIIKLSPFKKKGLFYLVIKKNNRIFVNKLKLCIQEFKDWVKLIYNNIENI